VDRVIVSTDSAAIAEVARGLGAEVPFLRPAEFATDAAPKILAIRHAAEYVERNQGFEPEIVVDLDITVPLRIPGDIAACVDVLSGDPMMDAAVTVFESDRNPYYSMVEMDERYVHLVKQPAKGITRRQDAPTVYSLTGSVFAWRRDRMERVTHVFGGNWGAAVVPRERAIETDTELDFRFVEFLLSQGPPLGGTDGQKAEKRVR
jgi:CMP-N-acetylneuraminic acid synthetase